MWCECLVEFRAHLIIAQFLFVLVTICTYVLWNMALYTSFENKEFIKFKSCNVCCAIIIECKFVHSSVEFEKVLINMMEIVLMKRELIALITVCL